MGTRIRLAILAAAIIAILAGLFLFRERPEGGGPGPGVENESTSGSAAVPPLRDPPKTTRPLSPAETESSPPKPSMTRSVILRLLDRVTKEPVSRGEDVILTWAWQDPESTQGGDTAECVNVPRPGWVEIDISDTTPRKDFRLLVPGYMPESFSLDRPPTDGTLRLTPDPRCIRGILVFPPGEGWRVRCSVVSCADGSLVSRHPNYTGFDLGRVRGLPGRPGPFTFSFDPRGEFLLRVRWTRGEREDGETWWATRDFDAGDKGADLGTIEPERGVGLRARLIAGTPEVPAKGPALRALVHRGGGAALSVGYGDRRMFPRAAAWPRGVSESWENVEPDGVEVGGWWEWSGYLPGTEVVLLAPSFPGVWKNVRLPTEPGAVVQVELDASGPTADCIFHFAIEGRQPADWGRLVAGPCYDEDFRSGTGLLEAAIPLGHHRIVVEATLDEEEGSQELYEIEFDMKSPGRWETTFDLVPVTR